MRLFLRTLILSLAALALLSGPAGGRPAPEGSLIGIFYYPWYETPAVDGSYGHWAYDGHRPPLDIASSY